jgi:predicted ATPase
MILDDNNNPRVQAHGGAALVNFAEDAPKNILITYLDSIVNKLQDVLIAKVYDVNILLILLFNSRKLFSSY